MTEGLGLPLFLGEQFRLSATCLGHSRALPCIVCGVGTLAQMLDERESLGT